MRKYRKAVGRGGAVFAVVLALGFPAPAATADDATDPIIIDNPGDIITDPIDLGGTTEPGTSPEPGDPGTTEPVPSDSETTAPETTSPDTTLPGTGSGGTITIPLNPAPKPAEPAPGTIAPAPPVVGQGTDQTGGQTFGQTTELPFGQPAQEPGAGEIAQLPASPGATPGPSRAPAVKSTAPATSAAPVPLPEPVAKTLDSVVSVATGSPLHVQVITVFALLAAGFLYFRFMGSKTRRSPVRGHK
ncbi:hypothetical protein [Arthrobacter cupressi]